MKCEICQNWARAGHGDYKIKGREGIPLLTNHHENCPRYNDSLMDVWKVTVGGISAYNDNEQNALDTAGDEFDDETQITKVRMHREIFENLPEFDCF